MSTSETFETRSPSETEDLGGRLAARFHPGDVVALTGDLGAGKTCLVRGIARGLGVRQAVTSPTYAIIHEYSAAAMPLHHVDLYRLDRISDTLDVGIEEYLGGRGVTVVEWAEKISALLPSRAFRVRIDILDESTRRIEVIAPVIVLAIETSTARGSVALLRNDTPLAEIEFWRPTGSERAAPGRDRPADLFPALAQLLEQQQLPPRSIELVAVGTGPGSFTGIRVGIAAAKGLAAPDRRPLAAVGSFDTLARTALAALPADCERLCALGDARREEVYYALYDRAGRRVTDCRIGTLESIADEAHSPIWFVSSEIERFRSGIESILGGFGCCCESPWYPSAAVAGRLAFRQYEDGGRQGDSMVEPIYLRTPSYTRI